MTVKKKINPLGLKASDIRNAMQKKWAAPEWAVMWEVGEGTGGNGGRYADAVMMSLWPSRGLELHGVEIKVSRADWKREAKDPTKAEAIAKYCDQWWIHTPQGVVDDISDLPPAWGLREWTGKRWNTLKEAQQTEAKPVTRAFLAALLRRGEELMNSMINEANQEKFRIMQEYDNRRNEQFTERVNRAVETKTRAFKGIEGQVKELEEALGCSIDSFRPNMKVVGKTAVLLSKVDTYFLESKIKSFQNIANSLKDIEEVLLKH